MNNNSKVLLTPRSLFLIDSLGALVSALLLFGVLRTFDEYFGMPRTTLTYLSIIPIIFCIYSLTAFISFNTNWRSLLKGISIANLLYCCLTIILVIYHYQSLTIPGIGYFIGEIVLICALVYLEIKAIRTS